MLCKYAFGKIGASIISLMVVFTLVGWFTVDAYMIGQATNALFPIIPIMPVAVIAGIAMTVTALFGMKWMSKLSDIAVPLVLIFGIASIILSVKGVGGMAGLFAISPKKPITLNAGISLALGSFVCGAVAFTPDVCMERRPTARFAELNGRDAERAATLAYDRFELFPS